MCLLKFIKYLVVDERNCHIDEWVVKCLCVYWKNMTFINQGARIISGLCMECTHQFYIILSKKHEKLAKIAVTTNMILNIHIITSSSILDSTCKSWSHSLRTDDRDEPTLCTNCSYVHVVRFSSHHTQLVIQKLETYLLFTFRIA